MLWGAESKGNVNQHLLWGARAKGETVNVRCGLQWPKGAALVAVGVGLRHEGLALLFDMHPPPSKQSHPSGDDLVLHHLPDIIV